MIRKTFLAGLLLWITGCAAKPTAPQAPNPVEATEPTATVYQLIVDDLARKEPADSLFKGIRVWVDPEFSKGDSSFYSWSDELHVDQELSDALQAANKEERAFPKISDFGPNAVFKKGQSFYSLNYYKDGRRPIDARCLIRFWKAAYSKDGERAIIRFHYGPSDHGAVGTYLLRKTKNGWKIERSAIDYYA